MLLSADDAALFYRAWGALLHWVNQQRQIVPPFARPTPERPIEPAVALRLREVIWAEDDLRERFLAEGASELAAAERDLIDSWKHRVRGSLVIHHHLQKHSIFIGDGVYGVRGIYTPLAAMFPHVPFYVTGVLLPFRDVIITDGLLQSLPMQLSFGPGMRRSLKEQYSRARADGQIVTRLPWTGPELPAAPKPSPRRRTPRRS